MLNLHDESWFLIVWWSKFFPINTILLDFSFVHSSSSREKRLPDRWKMCFLSLSLNHNIPFALNTFCEIWLSKKYWNFLKENGSNVSYETEVKPSILLIKSWEWEEWSWEWEEWSWEWEEWSWEWEEWSWEWEEWSF